MCTKAGGKKRERYRERERDRKNKRQREKTREKRETVMCYTCVCFSHYS